MPAGDWARSTSVDAGLSRATGFEGTTGADVTWARSLVDEGSAYVYSFELHAVAAQTFNVLVNYYDAPSGGTFLGNSGATVPVVMAAGETARFAIGPYVTPEDCESAAIKFNDVDPGGLEITAVRVSPSSGSIAFDTLAFDGATTNASWDGTVGKSTSTWRALLDPDAGTLTGESLSVVSSDIGPVSRDFTAAMTESYAITASGTIVDAGSVVDGFLIMQLSYDEGRGRVRLAAFTFADSVVQAIVERRAVTEARWSTIRGGVIPVVAGVMTRQADDYEYPAGVTVDYRVRGVSAAGVTMQQATTRRAGVRERPWLKFIPRPIWNRKIAFLADPVSIETEDRNALYQVKGATLPVVVTEVHGSRSFPLTLVARDEAERAALYGALTSGVHCYLQVDPSAPVPSIYAAVGRISQRRPSRGSSRWLIEVQLREVAPPPPSVVGAGRTYVDVAGMFASYGAALTDGESRRYVDLAD